MLVVCVIGCNRGSTPLSYVLVTVHGCPWTFSYKYAGELGTETETVMF